VDGHAFAEVRAAPRTGDTLCFLGSMDWLPNIDGMEWFLSQVWPGLHQSHPDWKLKIIGRKPPPGLVAAHGGRDGVTFTGTVDDVRDHLKGCSAAIVPLRIGGGTRLKILELMASGIPVVSTTIGAEGLPLEHGRHFLQADEPVDLAAAVKQVMGDATLAEGLARAAIDEVVTCNDWAHVVDIFLNLAQRPIV
jgi:glycosyltransferase involved in cell wall biosynthesis